ncbi:MAG TPA: hypothetical protein VH415_09205 [Nitrososphaeraceae archaeon]|jgi:hypothetical protein
MKQVKIAQRLLLAGTLLSTLFVLNGLNVASAQSETGAEHTEGTPTVVRDSATVLLGGRTLPGNDFIHLYDTTPYIIMNGHVAAKLPCNEDSESPLKVLIGSAPNLTAADFEVISQLSNPGEVCLYHVDLESMHGGNASDIITDIALQNPTEDAVEFGPTDTVVIGVNEIMKGAHEGHEGEEEAASGDSAAAAAAGTNTTETE